MVNELPPQTEAMSYSYPEEVTVTESVATPISFENIEFSGINNAEASRDIPQEVAHKDQAGNFVIDAARFNTLTPEESFALAGDMVGDVARERQQKEELEEGEILDAATKENTLIAQQIQNEIAIENAQLEAKYGPKENWPIAAQEQQRKHELGWGLAAVGALSVAGGFAADNAEARDNSGFNITPQVVRTVASSVLGRGVKGAEIERNTATREQIQEINYESKMEVLMQDRALLLRQKDQLNMRVDAHNQKYSQMQEAGMFGASAEQEANRESAQFDREYTNISNKLIRIERSIAVLKANYDRSQALNEIRREDAHDRATTSAVSRAARSVLGTWR